MQDIYLISGLLFCGALSVLFLWLYLVDIRDRQDMPLFSAEWKGLGSGLSGWRISRPLAYALLGVAFGLTAAVLIAQKVGLDHALAAKRAEYDYELQKQRESEERKYRDADLARKAELEKARMAPAGVTGESKK